MARTIISKSTVKDVYKLIEKHALVISENSTINKMLALLIEETKTRHVYVTDNENRLLGSVRLHSILTYFVPSFVLDRNDNEVVSDYLTYFKFSEAISIKDIMETNPIFVTEETELKRALILMGDANINEIPVVDQNKRILGELNLLKVAKLYLENQGKDLSVDEVIV